MVSTFIGPEPRVIALMGDKATAKRVLRDAGVATTPGSDVLASLDEAYTAAESIGYPLLLKATAGGGGRGMRVVLDPSELPRAYAGATAEAEASFKDGRLYVEKLIRSPRHIEVQVLGDAFGNIVHLGERDCSIQKPAHQKIIEETPAPHFRRDARATRCTRWRCGPAGHVGYTNAGTLEFLAAGDDVYFMEMNTRIQVEHPVTEMVYNIDLVKEQIRIAAGEPLGYQQSDLVARGHAIECRDQRRGHAQPLRSRRGHRVEAGLSRAARGSASTRTSMPGATIPPYYDSMIAKIVAYGDSREIAIARMERALRETLVEGVQTTIELCLEILATPAFREGRYDVEFLPKELALR